MKHSDFKSVLEFYNGKRVFVTGNTGFKGSWLTYILLEAGAKVTGYALKAPTTPSLFDICALGSDDRLTQITGDVRDLDALSRAVKEAEPEIVFHLAAQPIVRDSYKDPVGTYATNVMGTVNICEAVRCATGENGKPIVRSFLNVTTDKVYRNNEWEWGYRENDYLDGYDPYSNSKSCSELVTSSYRNSFFNAMKDGEEPFIRVSTARAGNVIGGGDFANDRIIPDCVRTMEQEGIIPVRNPYSTRPYQHVLEPLFAYLMIARAQYLDSSFSGSYNVGPADCDCVTTGKLVSLFADTWNEVVGSPKAAWEDKSEKDAPHEAGFLKLDCSKLSQTFDWSPHWHIDEAVKKTIEWTKVFFENKDKSGEELAEIIRLEMNNEISTYLMYNL